jgi:hypothetical protein
MLSFLGLSWPQPSDYEEGRTKMYFKNQLNLYVELNKSSVGAASVFLRFRPGKIEAV